MLLMWFTMILSSGQLSRMATSLILSVAFPQPQPPTVNASSSRHSNLTSDQRSTVKGSSNVGDLPEDPRGGIGIGDALIAGTYDYLSSHNFEEYLQELGVGYVLRRLASLASPSVTFTQLPCDSEKRPDHCKVSRWRITTSTIFRSHEIEFELGKPLVDTTMDGRRVMTRIDRTGLNEWTEVQRPCSHGDDDLSKCPLNTAEEVKGSTTLVRTFSTDRMQVDMKVGKVMSSSVFLRRILLHQPEAEEFDSNFPPSTGSANP